MAKSPNHRDRKPDENLKGGTQGLGKDHTQEIRSHHDACRQEQDDAWKAQVCEYTSVARFLKMKQRPGNQILSRYSNLEVSHRLSHCIRVRVKKRTFFRKSVGISFLHG